MQNKYTRNQYLHKYSNILEFRHFTNYLSGFQFLINRVIVKSFNLCNSRSFMLITSYYYSDNLINNQSDKESVWEQRNLSTPHKTVKPVSQVLPFVRQQYTETTKMPAPWRVKSTRQHFHSRNSFKTRADFHAWYDFNSLLPSLPPRLPSDRKHTLSMYEILFLAAELISWRQFYQRMTTEMNFWSHCESTNRWWYYL